MTFDQSKQKPAWYVTAALVLAGIATLSALMLTGTVSAAEEPPILGDANRDGRVSIKDATCVQMVLAEFSVSDFFTPAADVDGNGMVEITDATLIQRWLADMETPYPISEPFELPVETTIAPTTAAPTQMPTDEEGWGREIFRP